jgi:hypothetical protein
MKTRLGVATTWLTIALLTGSAIAVSAQDDAADVDLTTTTFVTGTLGELEQTEGVFSEEGNVSQGRGYSWAGPIETDDPRLTGLVTIVSNGAIRLDDGAYGQVDLRSSEYRIENDDGAWAGPATAFSYPLDGGVRESGQISQDTVVLTGEGSYDGLTAYLVIDYTVVPATLEGTAFAGEMPPAPEPVSAKG